MVVGLAAFDPVGWDRFGPIRWLLVPALGFWFVSSRIDRIDHIDRTDRVDRIDPGTGGDRRVAIVMMRTWAALVVWGFVATIVAADPLHAWLGTPDRRFGWITWILCGAMFAAATTFTVAERAVMTRAVAVGAALAGGYTLAEWSGLAGDLDFAGGRLGGPFGQPAYLGAAAVLALPVAIGVAADGDESGRWRLVGALGAGGGTLMLLGSQSRAAWIGLLLAVISGAVAVGIARRRTGDRADHSASGPRGTAPILLPAVVVGIMIAAVPALRSRITSSFDDGGVIQGRLDEWQVGWRALRQSPVVGYGPEGYRTVFGAHVDREYVIDWGREVITDRAHSGVLDTALVFGVPGGLLYAALMVLAVAAALRAIGRGDRSKVGPAVGVMAYAAQQQFLFPLSELDPLLWMAVGLLVSRDATSTEPDRSARSGDGHRRGRHGPPSPVRSAFRGLAIGAAVLVTIGGLLDLVANGFLASAVDRDDADRALGDVDTAITLRPDSIRYRFVASRLADRGGRTEVALSRVEQGLARSPADPALRGEEGRLQLARARETTSEPQRSQALDEAIETLEALVVDDPNHPEQLQRLGIALALNGEFDRGIELLERAVELVPDSPEPGLNLREALRLAGRDG